MARHGTPREYKPISTRAGRGQGAPSGGRADTRGPSALPPICRYLRQVEGASQGPAARARAPGPTWTKRRTGSHERARHRNRPGDQQFLRRRAARQRGRGAPQRLRRVHHRQRGGDQGERLGGGRQRRQGEHHPRPQAHRLLLEASDRPLLLLRGGEEGARDLLLRDRRGREPRRADPDPRGALLAARDRRHGAAGAEADRRDAARPGRQQGGHHGPRQLQRQPAAGDQGRRADRRARSAAHHERADRRGARLRLRQGPEPARRHLRPRRRHLRHLGARDRRATCSRCSPPAATPSSAATTSTTA